MDLPQIITACFFFLFPIFYTTITSESYEYNKTVLFILATIILYIISVFKMTQKKKWTIIRSTYTIPLFFLALIVSISALFQSPNIIIALTTPMAVTNIVVGFFFYMILISIIQPSQKLKFMYPLISSAFCISLYMLAIGVGIFEQSQFTPAGSILSTALFLSVLSVFLLTHLAVELIKKSDIRLYFGRALVFLIISCSTLILTMHLFTDQKPMILPHQFGWEIFLDVLKNPRTFFLGIGPSNFISAFTLAKSIYINQTPYWNIIFTSSSSYVLNLATETGIIALILYLTLLTLALRKCIHTLKKKEFEELPFILTLLYTLIIQILLPTSTVMYICMIIFLALCAKQGNPRHVSLSRLGPFVWVSVLPAILFISVVLYFTGRFYFAEVLFKNSLNSFLNNQGLDAYNSQKEAITLNPWIDRYHMAFSNISLSLANALAGKKDLTDEDKQNIPKLTQQAIEEAKLSTRLYPTNVTAWDNLAKIYSNLVNFAKGADQWAMDSYHQRLNLDPVNPQAKVNAAGLFMGLKKYDEAEQLLRTAILLKPDLVNAYFNLGLLLHEQKKDKEAYTVYQKALTLVPVDSDNGKLINAEIQKLPKDVISSSDSASMNRPLPTGSPSITQTP